MGQQSIVVVALSSLLLVISLLGIVGVWENAQDMTLEYGTREMARELSREGVSRAVAKLLTDRTWRDGFRNLAINGGSISVRIVEIGADSIRIESTSRLATVTQRIVAEVELQSVFPACSSVITIAGNPVELVTEDEQWVVDGRDWKADLSGIASKRVLARFGTGFTDSMHIRPKTDGTRVSHRSTSNASIPTRIPGARVFDFSRMWDAAYERRTITLDANAATECSSLGTLEKPEIVYLPDSLCLSGPLSGAGILMARGGLSMVGKVRWTGIVLLLAEDNQPRISGTGSSTIVGAVWAQGATHDSSTRLIISGTPAVHHSAEAVSAMLARLGLLRARIHKYLE